MGTKEQLVKKKIKMQFSLDRLKDVLFWGIVSAFTSVLCSCLGLTSLTTFITLWLSTSCTVIFLSSLQIPLEGKAVFITGCDSGFGLNLALHLHQLGFRVFAGCLMAESCGKGAEELKQIKSDRLHVVQLDVTKQDQMKGAVKQVKELLPKEEVLWAIVNNAGLSTFGEVEWVPVEVYRKIAEVNALGLVSATKAFLPLLRQAGGRVINVASMLGRMAHPMRSPYVCTKYAVEGFSDCLRQEMRPWGVKVSIIEPGNFVAGTDIFTDESVKLQADAMWSAMEDDLKKDVGREYFDEQVNLMMSYTNGGITDISPVIECMTEAIMQQFPRARYQPMDISTWIRILIATHLPEWIYDNIYVNASRH
ncbi:(2R,3R)-2,3-butanediol dehydrogenase [Halocaridina rubra]|uniref:(2R,3R)-2,3-butanediol dehydrogenase n=1 Tax=Halocaridina rubra TaxID=373956 RepID=A0AAN8XGV3_HALRR